jgi:type IV secretory pathway TraG/TraD family ATPase VirD4
LNFIKASLLAWLERGTVPESGGLLEPDPEKRHRFVVSLDEGHLFQLNEGEITDAKAIAHLREAGLVHLLATQSLNQLNKGTPKGGESYRSIVGTWLIGPTNSAEHEDVLKLIGKVEYKRLSKSYGSSKGSSKGVGNQGRNHSEQVQTTERPWISQEYLREFKPGMAILLTQNSGPRLIFLPHKSRMVYEGHKSKKGRRTVTT